MSLDSFAYAVLCAEYAQNRASLPLREIRVLDSKGDRVIRLSDTNRELHGSFFPYLGLLTQVVMRHKIDHALRCSAKSNNGVTFS